jgi:hypothetical protein
LWGCISLLLSSTKKIINIIFPLSSFLASACLWAHVHARVLVDTLSGRKKIRGSSKLLDSVIFLNMTVPDILYYA